MRGATVVVQAALHSLSSIVLLPTNPAYVYESRFLDGQFFDPARLAVEETGAVLCSSQFAMRSFQMPLLYASSAMNRAHFQYNTRVMSY